MATEKFPIKIRFKLLHVVSNETQKLLYPVVTISLNDQVKIENVDLGSCLDRSDNSDNEFAVVEFNVEVDDDIEKEHQIIIHLVNDNHDEIFDSKVLNEETGFHEDWGLFVDDIELNEISIESLVHTNGVISAPLSKIEDKEDDGFIQDYLIPNNMENTLSIVDGKYWYTTNGDYVHMPNTTYIMAFKTPLYLWLLELLLQ
jgi:hypothetical protein